MCNISLVGRRLSVPNLWDKLPEAPSVPELNPLTNPLLERNLRRWANVYFGNPPAKRQQAVSRLLEELKRESVSPTPSGNELASPVREMGAPGVVCSACHHQNPPGHKFCSRCGETLSYRPSTSAEIRSAPPVANPQTGRPANDVQWVGEPNFSSLDRFDGPSKRRWKYLAGAVAIALAGFVYLQVTSAPKSSVASTTTRPQASQSVDHSQNGPSSANLDSPPKAVADGTSDAEAQNKSVSAPSHDQSPLPAGLQPAAQRSPLPDAGGSGQPTPAEPSGTSDLRLAQRYLEGSMGERDSSEAARLLWKAVRKQNAAAEVLLSDLYLRGDGVPQSCDQARLLLVAAAKRGAPHAAEELRNLESRGCR